MQRHESNINGFWDFLDTQRKPSSIYPTTYQGLPSDMDDWGCDAWKIYYTRNKQAGGKVYAMDVMNLDAERVHSFADLSTCKYNCEFVKFMRGEGFSIDSFISDLYCDTTGIVSSVTGGVSTISKFILPIVLIGGSLIGYNYYKDNYK